MKLGVFVSRDWRESQCRELLGEEGAGGRGGVHRRYPLTKGGDIFAFRCPVVLSTYVKYLFFSFQIHCIFLC